MDAHFRGHDILRAKLRHHPSTKALDFHAKYFYTRTDKSRIISDLLIQISFSLTEEEGCRSAVHTRKPLSSSVDGFQGLFLFLSDDHTMTLMEGGLDYG